MTATAAALMVLGVEVWCSRAGDRAVTVLFVAASAWTWLGLLRPPHFKAGVGASA